MFSFKLHWVRAFLNIERFDAKNLQASRITLNRLACRPAWSLMTVTAGGNIETSVAV
jgi:hypothetical protein